MRRVHGSILVVMLFVMTMMGFIALSLTYRAGVEMRAVRDRAILTKLRAQAYSAVAIAIGRLTENTNGFDHLAEPWHTHLPLTTGDWLADWQQDPDGQPPEYVTTYSVIDEEGKLHLEYASSQALETLGFSTEQVAGLFDWVDADDVTQSEGAETDYYAALLRPYRCKNAPVETLQELLRVRGFGAGDYLGEDANHDGLLDTNEDDGSLSYPQDNADGMLRRGVVDLLTVFGDGRINLNTAPRQVLLTLPISSSAVDQIVAYRDFDTDSSGELEEHAFVSVTDIEQLQGLSDPERLVLIGASRFASEHFRVLVRSVHVLSGLSCTIDAVVQSTSEGPRVIQWRQGA